MKIVIINGSARKGNTLTAINTFIKGAAEHNEIEMISPDKLHIAPCKGCKACQCHKGCVDQDDTNPTIDKIAAADMILFATPVYWWGMSGQLKLMVDKFYAASATFRAHDLKIGTIAIGGAKTDDIEYKLINDQMDCIAKHLKWDNRFFMPVQAYAANDIKNGAELKKQISEVWKYLV